MSEEKRIYVVVAETVDTPNGRIKQPCGRAMAQACHAVGKMQVTSRIYRARDAERAPTTARLGLEDMPFRECTTIILAARDSKELSHVELLLAREGINRYNFWDTNGEVYGASESEGDAHIMTALAIEPIEPIKVYGILNYLPLWGCQCA